MMHKAAQAMSLGFQALSAFLLFSLADASDPCTFERADRCLLREGLRCKGHQHHEARESDQHGGSQREGACVIAMGVCLIEMEEGM